MLNKFNHNQEFPKINKQFVLDLIKTISSPKSNSSQKTKEENITNANDKADMKRFYNDVFFDLVDKKPCYSNKTFILA